MISQLQNFLKGQPDNIYRISVVPFVFFVKSLEYALLTFSFVVLFLWLISFYLPLPQNFFSIFYVILWIGVALEFAIKLYFVKHRLEYVKNEWFSIIILLFPILRPLQIFGISRFIIIVITKQLYENFSFLRESRLLEILLISFVVVILSADLFLLFEKDLQNTKFTSFSDALWFSVVTVATIGYGDVVPISTEGRLLATFLIVFGVSIFGIITGSISSYLVAKRMKGKYATYTSVLAYAQDALHEHESNDNKDKLDEILKRLEKLEKKI
jgi:voltage-gated potassium channel